MFQMHRISISSFFILILANAVAIGDEATATIRGKVTAKDGTPLPDTLVRAVGPAVDMRFLSIRQKEVDWLRETRTQADGTYQITIKDLDDKIKVAIDAMKPGYQRLAGTMMQGGDAREVTVSPGANIEADLTLQPSLYFEGIVTNDEGQPIGEVDVFAELTFGNGTGGVEITRTRADGTFEIYNYAIDPGLRESKGRIHFEHSDYISAGIGNVYQLAPDKREQIEIVLPTGRRIAGRLVDVGGAAVVDAVVTLTNNDVGQRKGTTTDGDGRFEFHGLQDGAATIEAIVVELQQKVRHDLVVGKIREDLELQLLPFEIEEPPKGIAVLGLALTDVTPELKDVYSLGIAHGALVINPGDNPNRLGIGELKEGDNFRTVGNTGITSVRTFVEQVIKESEVAKRYEGKVPVRVVYNLTRKEFRGTNTQYLMLSDDDILQLKKVLVKLEAE